MMTQKFLPALLLTGLTVHFAIAQTVTAQLEPKPEVRSLIDQAKTESKAFKYVLATKHLNEAIKKAREIGDVIGEGQASEDLGRVFYDQGDYKQALGYYNTSYSLFQRAGDKKREMHSFVYLGQAAYATGDNKKARSIFDQALVYYQKVGDKASVGLTTLNIAFTDLRSNNYQDYLKHATEAKDVLESVGDKTGQATAMNQIALALRNLKRRDEATSQFEKNVEFARANGLKSQEGTALSNLGDIRRNAGDFQKAIDYYVQSIKIFREASKLGETAQIGINLGIAYFQVGQAKLSVKTLRESAEIFEKFGNKPKHALTLLNLGVVLDQIKDNGAAEKVLKRSIKLYDEMNQHKETAGAYATLAAIYMRQNKYKDAEQMIAESIKLSEAEGDELGIGNTYDLLGSVQFYRNHYTESVKSYSKAASLYLKLENGPFAATTFGNMARAKSKLGQLESAESDYRESIRLYEEARRSIGPSAEGKAELLSRSVDVYQQFIALLVERGKVEEAFQLTQKTKARSLLDMLEGAGVAVVSEMTPAERAREDELRKKADAINAQMVKEGAENKTGAKVRYAELKKALQSAENELSEFKTQLYATHPGLEDKRSDRTASLAEVVSVLPEDGVLLEYVVAERSLVFVASHGSKGPEVSCHVLPISLSALAKKVANFRSTVSNPALAYASSSKALYSTLIEPLGKELAGKTKIVVCPDGVLWDVPFAALSNDQFLAETFEVSYGYSATAFESVSRSAVSTLPQGSLLILANPDFGGSTRFGDNPLIAGQRPIDTPSRPIDTPSRPIDSPSRPIDTPSRPIDQPSRDLSLGLRNGIVELPGTQAEAEALKRLYPDAKVLTAMEAQESAFDREAPHFRYLHIASHAFFNDASPLLSSIVLAKPFDSSTDGFLTARELFDMKLNADLVVLSACNTARGAQRGGEGVIGLSWALFAAGAPSQVVSQWSVDDLSAATLMTRFYENLKAGKSKAASLQAASVSLLKKDHLNQAKWRHPYYWAPFILMGNRR